VATPELRNTGTIGGNICQFVRCWYYRAEHNAFPCLRKNPTGVCYALAGDNRYHSIFGAVNGCLAVNPSNTAPALVALKARIKTSERTINIDDFFTVNGEKTTVLDDDEIVTEIQIPTPTTGTKSAFFKFALRKAFDFPIVNCAAAITSAVGTVSAARICLNGVHNTPRRALEAEDFITGKAINDTNAEAAGSATALDATVLTHNSYMVQIVKTMVKRAILACR
jgi:xanthine dehydrogenase YagS FAD-binding subunit